VKKLALTVGTGCGCCAVARVLLTGTARLRRGGKAPNMRHTVEIENIEQLRRREGIDDAELRADVAGLCVGAVVNLTFMSRVKPFSGETLPVRITRIRGAAFRGKLAAKPASSGLAHLRAGCPVAFHADHIHSLVKGKVSHER
jgi:hypothetical protein